MHEHKKLRTVLSLLLSFFLSLCILGAMLALEYRVGITGKRSVREAMTESNYISNARNKITAQLGELLKKMNLPEELAEQMIEEDEIYLTVTNYVDAVFNGKTVTLDTTGFQESFNQVINQYLLKHNIRVSSQLDQSIKVATKSAESTYRQYLEPDFVKTIYQFSENLGHRLMVLGILCLIGAAIIIAVLLLMYHYKHHAVQFLLYSMIAAIGMNVFAAFGLRRILSLEKLGVGPEYYLEFLNQYLKGGENLAIAVSVMAIVVALALVGIGRRLKHSIK